jgi:alkyldihydroxyacetonephosphate synthase
LLRFLQRETGASGRSRQPPVAADEVQLTDSALPSDVRARLAVWCGVREDREARLAHAGGKSYDDLIRRRAGEASAAPDAVLLPASAEAVRSVLEVCSAAGVAVVPFGGGTSVVGGVEPLRGEFAAVVALDLSGMDAFVDVDEESLTATFQPGIRTPRVERLLSERGLTLGHLPQSYEQASLGGYVATRSAGQASTGHGRIDELVVALRCQTPSGELALGRGPASAAGPDLRQLIVGSEGVFGVITELTVRVRRLPAQRRYEGYVLPDFAAGQRVLRRLAQEEALSDVVRLSDEAETRVTLAMAGGGRVQAAAIAAYLRLRRVSGGCLLILGWEGQPSSVAFRRKAARLALTSERGVSLGRSAGEAWRRGRFSGPYLRDDLLDHGILVETLETATTWRELPRLHDAVQDALVDALRDDGRPPLVGCHISHVYPTGASLYFTVLTGARPGAEIEQWDAAKRAATDAIMATSGTLTHHHAVGSVHASWLAEEIGELGVDVLRTVKARLDPAGILNPGKLLP